MIGRMDQGLNSYYSQIFEDRVMLVRVDVGLVSKEVYQVERKLRGGRV